MVDSPSPRHRDKCLSASPHPLYPVKSSLVPISSTAPEFLPLLRHKIKLQARRNDEVVGDTSVPKGEVREEEIEPISKRGIDGNGNELETIS